MTGEILPSVEELVGGEACQAKERGFRPSSSATTNFWVEIRLFIELTCTTTLLNIGFFMTPFLTASYVGRLFGPLYLSGFTLGNLTGNLCTFSLLSGIFSASDTLSPQAFGVGNYAEVGYIAIRGIVAAVVLLLPMNIFLVLFLEPCLVKLGQNSEAASLAMSWYRIFVFSLPFSVVYTATCKFLSAQHVMWPLIVVSIICTGVILPLVLELCMQLMGFLGSAMCYVLFQAFQATLLLCYVWWTQPHDSRTWPGFRNWRRALKLNPMMEYFHLGAGGILAQSEWVFWEALGLVVGMLGVVALSSHTIPNQTIMALIQIPFSCGTAVAIRMGVTLSTSVRRTQSIALAVSAFSIVAFGLVSITTYISSDWIISIFTTDRAVEELSHTIWFKVCLFNFIVAQFDVLWGIATGLGKQWSLGIINFVFLWIFGIPVIYFEAIVHGGGLDAVWTWINVLYAGMNFSLIILFMGVDWDKIQEKINDRESVAVDPNTELERVVDETTHFL